MEELREKVIADYCFPFKFTDKEYFEYYVDLYQKDFALKGPWEDLLVTTDDLGGEHQLYKYYDSLINDAIDDIKAKEAYQAFNSAEMPEIGKREFEVSKQSPYHDNFHSYELISIDLVKANYQVLRNFDANIVNNSANYLEFISGFTPYNYFRKSPQTRQKIFSQLNPKRQQAFQKRTMEDLLERLWDVRKDFTFHGLASDEVFVYAENEFAQLILEEIKEILQDFNLNLRIELFRLVSLGRNCFVKEFLNEQNQVYRIEFKGVPEHLFPQAYKHYYKMDLNEKDMTFIFEDEKALLKNRAF